MTGNGQVTGCLRLRAVGQPIFQAGPPGSIPIRFPGSTPGRHQHGHDLPHDTDAPPPSPAHGIWPKPGEPATIRTCSPFRVRQNVRFARALRSSAGLHWLAS